MLDQFINDINFNKHFDYCGNELLYLIGLLQDYFAVELYRYSSDKKITNKIIQQIKNDNSIIIIKCSYFQEREEILFLMQSLSEEERKISLRLALEKSFNRNLSNGKIIIESDCFISTL